MSAREYVLAALLHDVGKLIQRARAAGGEPVGSHTRHSLELLERLRPAIEAAGLDFKLVYSLVEGHHSEGGIGPADKAAASERASAGDDEGDRSVRAACGGQPWETPLEWCLEGQCGHVPPYPLSVGGEADLLPVEERLRPRPCGEAARETPAAYREAAGLLRDLAERVAARRMSFGQLVETLVHVLRAAALFVPAATYGVSRADTSLYAHSLLAAALASAGGAFRVVTINVGGIQDYLTRVHRAKRAMAILRGRSLYVFLLQRALVRRFLDEVNRAMARRFGTAEGHLTAANVLVDSGGEAVLLIPAYHGDEEDLEAVAGRLEREVVEATGGMLRASIGWSGARNVGRDAFSGDNFRRIMAEAEERRLERRLSSYVQLDGGPAKARCDMCRRPADRTERVRLPDGVELELCSLCRRQLELGLAARNLKAVAELAEGTPVDTEVEACRLREFEVLGVRYVVVGHGCEVRPAVEAMVRAGARLRALYLVNNTRDFVLDLDGVAYGFLFLNAHLPLGPDGAFRSVEDAEIAVTVRADGNEMGRLKVEAQGSPSRFLTFSSVLSTVFDLYGNLLASHRDFRDHVYLIYSGGDDLAAVGTYRAYSYVAKVAQYAGHWGFKVAAGAVIHDPLDPVLHTWAEAGRREEAAKRDRKASKVAAAPLGDDYILLSPDEVKKAVERGERLYGAVSGLEAALARSLLLKAAAHLRHILTAAKTGNKRETARALIRYAYHYHRLDGKAKAALREYDPQTLTDMAIPQADAAPRTGQLEKLFFSLATAYLIDRTERKERTPP